MFFELWSSYETFIAYIAFVRPFIFTNMLQIVSFPIVSKFQALFLVTYFADQNNFDIRIFKVFNILQTSSVACFTFGNDIGSSDSSRLKQNKNRNEIMIVFNIVWNKKQTSLEVVRQVKNYENTDKSP